MKIGKRVAFGLGLLFALSTAPLGFSQSGSGSTTSNGGSSSKANSNSNAGANANNEINMGSAKAPFTEALPGATDTVIPGQAPEAVECKPYYPAAERYLTMAEIRSYAKHVKVKMHYDVGNTDAVPVNDDGIEIVDYNPEVIAWSGDEVLGHFIVEGQHLHPDIGALSVAFLEAKKLTHTRRVAIIDCPEAKFHTKSLVGGLGGAFSEIPGSGNTANSAALGFSIGSSTTTRETYDVYRILALDDWPEGVPHTVPHNLSPTPPASEEQPAPKAHPEPTQLEMKKQAPAPSPTPPPPPVQATLAPAPPVNPCASLAELNATVYFDLNESIVKPKYLSVIRSVEDWMENHPSCNVQVEGYASIEAGFHYNDGLAQDRALRVYNIMREDKSIAARVVRHFSAGKYFVTEHSSDPKFTWEDRKVTFSIRNITMGSDQ